MKLHIFTSFIDYLPKNSDSYFFLTPLNPLFSYDFRAITR